MEEKDKKQVENQDVEIDLSEVFNTIKENKVKYAGVIAGCAAVALSFALVQPPKYESTAVVRAKIVSAIDQLDGKKPNKDEMASYLEIMRSRSVIEPVIAKTKSLTEESAIRKNKDVNAFVNAFLKYNNPKGTDLIKISATAKTPEEAQFIAQSVLENSTETLTNVNKMGRSSHIDFLQERKDVAEAEMKDAESSLENFKQESKVFAPDSQLENLVKQLNEVDRDITNIKTNLEIRTKQMELLDDGASVSAFNTGDSTTNAVRSSLLQEQLKLQEQLQFAKEQRDKLLNDIIKTNYASTHQDFDFDGENAKKSLIILNDNPKFVSLSSIDRNLEYYIPLKNLVFQNMYKILSHFAHPSHQAEEQFSNDFKGSGNNGEGPYHLIVSFTTILAICFISSYIVYDKSIKNELNEEEVEIFNAIYKNFCIGKFGIEPSIEEYQQERMVQDS